MRPIALALALALVAPIATLSPREAHAQEPAPLARRVLGEWRLVLDEADRRQLEALELAFRDPVPSDDEIAAAALADDAAMLVGLIVGLRRVDPEDPALAAYREGLIGLRGARFVVTESAMTLSFGSTSSTQTYQVIGERGDRLRIEVRAEDGSRIDAVLRLREEEGLLQYAEAGRDGQRLDFRR